jgi:hypothetical protein
MVVDHGRYQLTTEWHWITKFAWLPAKMNNGNFIWWREYYHGFRLIHPAGENPVMLNQYLTPQEYLFRALKES